MNIGRDENKSGFLPEAIGEAIAQCEKLSANLQLEGLMTILPYDDNPEVSRPHFQAMSDLRGRLVGQGLNKAFHNDTILLSMGMSDDFAIAIEEGADIVRVGTAIFGNRS